MSVPSPQTYVQGQGTVGADQLNSFQQNVLNPAQLRNLVGVPTMVIFLTGINAPGDGGQGQFYWNATSTAADDNKNVIRPNGVATGAWLRIQIPPTTGSLNSVNAISYGADPTGIGDSTSAMLALAALPSGSAIYFPAGNYYCRTVTGTIFFNGIVLWGDGAAVSVIYCTVALGAGVPFIDMDFTFPISAMEFIRGLGFYGPGTRVLGTKTANVDGVRVSNTGKVSDIAIQYFDNGFTFNSSGGHIVVEYPNFANNYAGVYIKVNNGDHLITQGFLNGNTFAGMYIPANQSWQGIIRRVHMGFQPWGIYQDSTTGSPEGSFLQDVTLDTARFEQIGNGAIYTDLDLATTNSCLWIFDPGFSWGLDFTIPGTTPQPYAVTLGFVNDAMKLVDGPDPFTAPPGAPAGSSGGVLVGGGTSASIFHEVHGDINQTTNFSYIKLPTSPGPNGQKYNVLNKFTATASINPGQTSVTVTGPPNAYPAQPPTAVATTAAPAYWISGFSQGATNWQLTINIAATFGSTITFFVMI